jgi:peptidyl-prolyl cis-trans isomerase D
VLDTLRRGQRWLTALFVLAVGGVFVLFIGIGQPLKGRNRNTIVQVGPYEYDHIQFQRVRERRANALQESLGDSFDPKKLRDTLDQLALQTLVERGLLSLEARSLGFTVGKEEIERTVREAPLFKDESGRFDRAAFERFADYEYGNQRNFIEDQRQGLLATKLIRLLASQARVSEAEARNAVRQRLEAVQIAYVALDAKTAPPDFQVTDEQVTALLTTREADARALYEERLETYDVPEQVRARHILLRLEPGAAAETVDTRRKEAEAIRERLSAGEDFAKLASELSEDPGSKSSGGDLGFFKRGQMVKPFEDAAFALAPGELSAVVQSDFGFHLIRVEEKKAAQLRTFDDVKTELAKDLLAREAARAAAQATADRIAEAVRGGKTLEAAARAEGLTLERTGRLQRRPDGFVPGLGAAQDLLALAFALPAGGSSPRIFEVGDKLALVQVLERFEPTDQEVAGLVGEERGRLLVEKRRSLEDAWLAERRAALAAQGELTVNETLLGRQAG